MTTMPRIPAPTEPLSDDRVVLRLSAERDIPEILIAYQDDARLHLDMGEERPPSGAELGRREERAEGERADGSRLTLTVLEPGSDVCRGQLYAYDFDWDHERAELGIWVAPQVRGRGLATSALALASRWLIANCNLERLQITTAPDNERMLRAARAAGFSDEGVLRGHVRRRHGRADMAVLSIIRSELEG
jgi:[ribosomal protein S5]-alanine N-acetyltransferase